MSLDPSCSLWGNTSPGEHNVQACGQSPFHSRHRTLRLATCISRSLSRARRTVGGWRLRSGNDFVLACITTLSLLSMVTVMAGGAPAGLALADKPSSDDAFNRTYLTRKSVWGRNEFVPNYAALPQKCDVTTSEIQTTSFAELERGITARLTYIAAPSAPLGGVSYLVNGTPTLLSACDGSAMLGPVAVGSAVKAEVGTLKLLFYARIICLIACGLGVLAWPGQDRERHSPRVTKQ